MAGFEVICGNHSFSISSENNSLAGVELHVFLITADKRRIPSMLGIRALGPLVEARFLGEIVLGNSNGRDNSYELLDPKLIPVDENETVIDGACVGLPRAIGFEPEVRVRKR